MTLRQPWFATCLATAIVMAVGAGGNAMAGSIASVGPVPSGAVVLDLRAEEDCMRGSLPAARCLPASSLFGGEGAAPVSFHPLRWLLGTVGLNGEETVALLHDDLDQSWSVAGLLLLAGQNRVHVIEAAQTSAAYPGSPRSLSREVVYTAPLREDLMTLSTSDGGRAMRVPFAELAQGGSPVAFAPHR